MAEILPLTPYELQGDPGTQQAAQLRSLLEPSTLGGHSLKECAERFDGLVSAGRFTRPAQPCLYIYRQQTGQRQFLGLWCQLSSQGTEKDSILGHEDVLKDKLQQQQAYRKKVGLEGSPILAAYRRNATLDQLLRGWSMGVPDFSYQWKGQLHEFYRIEKPEEISVIQEMVAGIERLYIADGHHRLATAASYQPKRSLSTVLVASDQLQVQGYHRLIKLPSDFQRDKLLWALEKQWYRSAIPANRPYIPNQKGRMGMYLAGRWYQLDLRETDKLNQRPDTTLLQQTILAPGLGIHEPSTAPALDYLSEGELAEHLRTAQGEEADKIIFTLFPMGMEELMGYAENGIILPPKSTWIEPRMPYGLLINHLHTNQNEKA